MIIQRLHQESLNIKITESYEQALAQLIPMQDIKTYIGVKNDKDEPVLTSCMFTAIDSFEKKSGQSIWGKKYELTHQQLSIQLLYPPITQVLSVSVLDKKRIPHKCHENVDYHLNYFLGGCTVEMSRDRYDYRTIVQVEYSTGYITASSAMEDGIIVHLLPYSIKYDLLRICSALYQQQQVPWTDLINVSVAAHAL